MAATMNGGDAVKSANTASAASKQQLKGTAPTGKTLDGARKQAASPVESQNKKPQNAWSKGAPAIANRTPSAVNGASKPPPPTPAVSQGKSSADSNAERHSHDRSIWLLSQLVGKDVTLTLKSGEQFTGVFSGSAFDGPKSQYLLKMVRRTRLPSNPQTNGDVQLPHEFLGEGEDHAMSFDVQDAELSAQEVSTAAAAPQQNGSAGSFMTDAQISAKSRHRERELQRWDAGPDTAVDLSLEASGSGDTWDQFAANERMYGVSSSYDEDIYTTSIDRNNPEYKRQAAKAERIAREIENSAPANAHVAEERRRDAHRGDDAADEEEKYSGVARENSALPKRAAGAYVPPSQRPITGAPSVPGAPFDPAIISSQIKAVPAPPNAAKPAQEPPQPVQAPAPVVAEAVKAAPASSAAANSIEAPKKKEHHTTEDRVRDTADAFKQFANNEKLRLRAAQEQKRSNQRQEKNVKLNDLKKFAENFKLKSRVPDDLVPILAKDREKQLEIQKKADQAAKEEETRAKDRDSEKASSVTASPAPSSSVSQATPAPSADQRLPYNQQNRARGGQQVRPQGPPGQFPNNVPLSQRLRNNLPYNHRGGVQPLPADLRIPSGPPQPLGADMPMSPNSATRLNVSAKVFEFRPGASAFTPTGTSPSPQRIEKTEEIVPFFSKGKKKETKPMDDLHDSIKRMAEADIPEHAKLAVMKNGGVPQAFNTVPTWTCPKSNENLTHDATFPKAQRPASGPSPLHNPNPAQIPHAHQLPAHMQGVPPMPAPNQRQQFYGQPQPGHAPSFDPRLQHQFGPNGSVQNSPRVQQVPVAPFNGQMPPMQMQQFPGQPLPPYGMSPSMQYRQMAPQGAPMMMPGGSQPMMPMRPGFGGPQFNPQMGGGHVMMQNPSQGYQSGPMPQNYGGSPMPPHAQPQMPHMQQHGSFSGSPRPHMMSHQGSHQGFQPGMPMQPHYAPSPGQYPHHMQHRAMSSGYPQMTPRQQAAVPNQPSPGMGVTQGDEGK